MMTRAENWNGFVGKGARANDDDIAAAAASLGDKSPAMLRAFMKVETSGSGFDHRGRPKMLFEPLHFHNMLKEAVGHGELEDEVLERAIRVGVASATRPAHYPSDSYPRLLIALDISEELALQACSWGLGQVLGENHEWAGFGTASEMVRACMDSEHAQIDCMVGFIRHAGLQHAFLARDFLKLAQGYNGRGQHGYDGRLREAYALESRKASSLVGRLAAVPRSDTSEPAKALAPSMPKVEDGPQPDPHDPTGEWIPGDHPDAPPITQVEIPVEKVGPSLIVRAAQEHLLKLHYFGVGKADGLMGPRTIGALSRFQADQKIPVSGSLDEDTLARLEVAPPAPVDEARASTTIDDLRKAGSVTVKRADAVKTGSILQGGVAAIFATVTGASDFLGPAWSTLSEIKQGFADVPAWAWALALVGLALVLYWKAHQVQEERLNSEKSGRLTAVPEHLRTDGEETP